MGELRRRPFPSTPSRMARARLSSVYASWLMRAVSTNGTPSLSRLLPRGVNRYGPATGVIVHQLIGRDESLDPQPGFPRGGTHQGHRRMAHLLAPIDVEGALRREAGGERARVILPPGTGVKLARILGEA